MLVTTTTSAAVVIPNLSGKVAERQLADQTIVIRIGGSTLRSPSAAKMLSADVADMVAQGARVILAHGGGSAISERITASGRQCRFLQELIVTDDYVLTVAGEVLNSISASLIAELKLRGIDARGINSGINGSLLTARKKFVVEPSGVKLDIGWVGEITAVDVNAFRSILAAGGVPVCVSLVKDADGLPYNVSTDNVAISVAVDLKADKLVYLTDVPGIVLDGVVLPDVPIDEVSLLIESGIIKGGMIPKIRRCALALRRGIKSVIITSADSPGELLSAVLSPGKRSTVLSQ